MILQCRFPGLNIVSYLLQSQIPEFFSDESYLGCLRFCCLTATNQAIPVQMVRGIVTAQYTQKLLAIFMVALLS